MPWLKALFSRVHKANIPPLNEKAHRAERKEIRVEFVEWAILIFVISGVIVDALLFFQERHGLP